MNNDLHNSGPDAELRWRSAHIFAVGVDVKWLYGFHAQARSLKILHFPNAQVPAEVHRRKHARKPEGIDASNHAYVELAVIHFGVGCDLHSPAISWCVGESRQ